MMRMKMRYKMERKMMDRYHPLIRLWMDQELSIM